MGAFVLLRRNLRELGDGVGEPAGWRAALVEDPAKAPWGGIDGRAQLCAWRVFEQVSLANAGTVEREARHEPREAVDDALRMRQQWRREGKRARRKASLRNGRSVGMSGNEGDAACV